MSYNLRPKYKTQDLEAPYEDTKSYTHLPKKTLDLAARNGNTRAMDILVEDDRPKVFEKDGEVFANSRDVAEYFGKRHDNMIRSIEGIINEVGNSVLKIEGTSVPRNYELTYYRDKSNRLKPSYNMTKDGFTLLVMRFTGTKALKFQMAYIQRFNEMEATLKATQPEKFDTHLPRTFAEALRMAADQQDKIEQQQLQLELKTEKLESTEAELSVAQETIGKNDHQLLKFVRTMEGVNSMQIQKTLRDMKYLKGDNTPYARYLNLFYQRFDARGFAINYVTAKGKELLIKLKAEGKLVMKAGY